MIEDAWGDFPQTELKQVIKPHINDEDTSGLQLITLRHDGKGLYKDLRIGGYVICSPALKDKISKEQFSHDN